MRGCAERRASLPVSRDRQSRAFVGSGLTTLPSLATAKAGGLDYSQKSRIVGNGEVVVFVNPYGKYVAVKVMKVEDEVLGGSRNRVTIRWKVLQ